MNEVGSRKEFLILKPSSESDRELESPGKIINPETFEKLQQFSRCTYYLFDIIEYDSIHAVVPLLADMPEWMPCMGSPSKEVREHVIGDPEHHVYRRKISKDGEIPSIIEPKDDKGIFELDDYVIEDFNPREPERGIRQLIADLGLDCDVTYQLSASQRPDSEHIKVHLFFEYDDNYSLAHRKAHAASKGMDTSIQNGVNPVYIAPPVFKTSLDGEEQDDPLPLRIGFIEGEERKCPMPQKGELDTDLARYGKKIDAKKGKGVHATYISEDAALKDIHEGRNYHDAQLFLTHSWANHTTKHDKESIKTRIIKEMHHVPEGRRDARWYDRQGEELDRMIEGAIRRVAESPPPSQMKPSKYGGFRSFSDIEDEETEWDIYGFIASNRVNLLAGDRSHGKSSTCAWLAAMYSTGGEWIDGHQSFPEKQVAWLTAEESAGSEVRRRFIINGADLTMIHEMDAEVQFNSEPDLWDICRDRSVIVRKLKDHDIGVLIVDTAFSFAGDKDLKDGTHMRRLMLMYNAIAKEAGCTIIAILHLNKGLTGSILDDITGSAQVTAAVRVALALVKDKVTKSTYLTVVKNNNALEGSTVKYTFEYVPYPMACSLNSYARLIPMVQDGLTADDVRNANRRLAQEALTAKTPLSNKEAENVFCVILAVVSGEDAVEGISYAKLEPKITKFCLDKGKKPPGKSKLQNARKDLVKDGVVKMKQVGRATLYWATDETRSRADRAKKEGIFDNPLKGFN